VSYEESLMPVAKPAHALLVSVDGGPATALRFAPQVRYDRMAPDHVAPQRE